MDAALGTVGVGAGVAGVLASVIWYLLRANASDRKDYQEATDRAERRADESAARLSAAQVALDDERASRRRVEDALAEASRLVAGLRADAHRNGPTGGGA